MPQLTTPMLGTDKLEIEEGFNPRKTMDKEKLERMADSIQRHDSSSRSRSAKAKAANTSWSTAIGVSPQQSWPARKGFRSSSTKALTFAK